LKAVGAAAGRLLDAAGDVTSAEVEQSLVDKVSVAEADLRAALAGTVHPVS
jgi:hypothetical protein